MLTAPLHYIVAIPYHLFRVRLCPHGNLPLQDPWLHQNRRRSPQGSRSRGPESTRSLLRHVHQKGFFSEDGATRGNPRKHQSSSDDQCDRMIVINAIMISEFNAGNTWLRWRFRFHIGRSRCVETSAHCEDAWMARKSLISIEQTAIRLCRRLVRDRGSIAVRPHRDGSSIAV